MDDKKERNDFRWKMIIRIVLILLGIIQGGFIFWGKYVTDNLILAKSMAIEANTKIGGVEKDIDEIKDDMKYIRGRFDKILDRR